MHSIEGSADSRSANDKQRDRETERQRDRETEIEREKDEKMERQRDKERERERKRDREREIELKNEGDNGHFRDAFAVIAAIFVAAQSPR